MNKPAIAIADSVTRHNVVSREQVEHAYPSPSSHSSGYSSPIAYPSSLLHEPWRTLYGLNPMVGVVEGFR